MLQSDSAYIKLCRDIVGIFKLMTYILIHLELKSSLSVFLCTLDTLSGNYTQVIFNKTSFKHKRKPLLHIGFNLIHK